MKKINSVFVILLFPFVLFSACSIPAETGDIDTENTKKEVISENKDDGEEENTEEKDESSLIQNDADLLDFSINNLYSLKVGECVSLVSAINGESVFYEVQEGNDVVSYNGTELLAESVGQAVVKAISWEDEKHVWYCTVTVSAEGFNGNSLEYKLLGRWKDGESVLEFNADKTGYMKVYKNGSVIQESSFNWCAYENNYGKYLELTDGVEYINKTYQLSSIKKTSFHLNGYLAFLSAKETTWYKE